MGKIEWAGESTAALAVSDYGKALAWYRDVLGLKVVFELETWGWAQLQSPVDGLLIGIGQSEEVKTGGGATLTFTVKDIEAARAYLEGEGVRFDGEISQVEDMVRLTTFYDPDGNALMLAQQLKHGEPRPVHGAAVPERPEGGHVHGGGARPDPAGPPGLRRLAAAVDVRERAVSQPARRDAARLRGHASQRSRRRLPPFRPTRLSSPAGCGRRSSPGSCRRGCFPSRP